MNIHPSLQKAIYLLVSFFGSSSASDTSKGVDISQSIST